MCEDSKLNQAQAAPGAGAYYQTSTAPNGEVLLKLYGMRNELQSQLRRVEGAINNANDPVVAKTLSVIEMSRRRVGCM